MTQTGFGDLLFTQEYLDPAYYTNIDKQFFFLNKLIEFTRTHLEIQYSPDTKEEIVNEKNNKAAKKNKIKYQQKEEVVSGPPLGKIRGKIIIDIDP